MLLNKFQRDQERRQYREEAARRHEGHWRCPFFVYCWEERWTLPIVNNYPKCNGFYHDDRSYKKPRVDQRPQGLIIRERSDDRCIFVHDRLGGRVSVHDRLGAGHCYVILRGEGFLPMSDWSRWSMLEFQMSSRIAGIQKES